MKYTRFFEVSDIERFMVVEIKGAYARVNNGDENLFFEKFISFIYHYAGSFSLLYTDSGKWID